MCGYVSVYYQQFLYMVNDKALMDVSMGEINSIDTIGLVCGV